MLFSAALASLVYALIEAGRTSFTATPVTACFAAAAVLLIAFVIVEARSAHAMFDLRLFRLPTFAGGDIAAFGVSAGIALLGALFASRLASAVAALTARTPFAAHSAQIATALRSGSVKRVVVATPPRQRGLLAQVVTGSFTTALNEILLVAGIISFASGVLAFVLIRSKDFVTHAQPGHAAVPSGQSARASTMPQQ